MMSPNPVFDAQLLGQTEKACNAILDRLLTGSGLTEPRWIALRLTVMSGDAIDRHELVNRVAGALKVGEGKSEVLVQELAASGLLHAEGDGTVELSDAGRELHEGIRGATSKATERLWGDLPADDLAVAGRVLSTVLHRANAELAGG
jgi:hypothetical protein